MARWKYAYFCPVMAQKRILVTGGLGYIGSHTTVDLIKAGFDVHLVDNLSNSRIEILDKLSTICGSKPAFTRLDLRDSQTLAQFFDDNAPFDAIIHFAALKSVVESVRQPLLYYENNVGALLNLIREAGRRGISDLVFSSSCTVYGQPDQNPVSELSAFNPAASPYGESKQICEQMLMRLCQAGTLRVVSLRYFNPIGAHDSALLGEWTSQEPDNLMPYITQAAVGLRRQLRVFGDDYSTPDGTAIRDYIHVCDLANAHVSALHYLFDRSKPDFRAFNIGTGRGYSVLEVIRSFERVSGISLNFEFAERRPGDVEKIWADSSLAAQELGYSAILGLDEMTSSAWRWQLALLNEQKL
jgi:UDP-glucose 4-epimerase